MPVTSMTLRTSGIMALALLAVGLPGCTSMFSKRAIEQFAESLQQQDLDGLKAATSDEFREKALRQTDSARGLKMLKLPTGKVEIAEVEDLERGQRRVLVKVGEKGQQRELEYRLAHDGQRGRWVVDDVVMRQDSGGGNLVERSVTDQMNLLLSCRELLLSWKDGDRSEKLSFCDDGLRGELEKLPEPWLEKLSQEVAGSGRQGTFKPDARLSGDRAFVAVPHANGKMFLEMRDTGDRWLLHDLAVEPTARESTGIRSLTKMLTALNRSAEFLQAYGESNREKLETSATDSFYRQCLAGAPLNEVPLPVDALLKIPYDARQFTDGTESVRRMELLLKDQGRTYMLTLREVEQEDSGSESDPPSRYLVDEVTIFEADDKDVKRMSSLFLSRSVIQLYLAALRERDVKKLKELSSTDFNDRVWNRPEASHFVIMPEPVIAEGEAEIISTVFRGELSEITVAHGDVPMTLVLRTARGWMVIDDVLMPALDRPMSLKENLELELTLHAFAAAIHKGDLQELIRFSADGLDDRVWRQLAAPPELSQQLLRPMLSEVVEIRAGEPWTLVRTSDGKVQAEVKLVREGTRFVVHDVSLISAANPAERLDFTQVMRQQIAAGLTGRGAAVTPAVQQAAAESPRGGVQQAVFEPIEPSVYSR